MPGIASSIYNAIFRQNPVFLTSVFAGAFAFEIGFDNIMTKLWDANNRGRQWKDIRQKYVEDDS